MEKNNFGHQNRNTNINYKTSNIYEKTFPSVVIIAITDHIIKRLTFDCSTACLAWNENEILFIDVKLKIRPRIKIEMNTYESELR